jgi:hypothetical protein
VQWGGFVTAEALTKWMDDAPGDFVPGYIFFWQEYLRVTKGKPYQPDDDHRPRGNRRL